MRYLLGVDGGNTKTDYLIYTEDGAFVDVYRCGTCSHEQMRDSYDGMERTLREQLSVILTRNHINPVDIAAGGFGLAGADLPSQVKELTTRVRQIGIGRFTVSNDGILGVKASSDNGIGLCVVNGTGTVVIGIDQTGQILQVSGMGEISGDQAGGGHALRQILHGLYAYYFRCGEYSSLFPAVMELLDLKPEGIMEAVYEHAHIHRHMKEILQLADREAQSGDAVAMRIFDEMGISMGHSAAGCVKLLNFDDIGTEERPLSVVLVGSIWHKINYAGTKNAFKNTFHQLTKKTCRLIPLNAPAAVGGVLWAKEMLDGKPVAEDYRKKVLDALTLEQYETLAYKKEPLHD